MSKLWILCVFMSGCVLSTALGGLIAYYPLDDTWTGDSYYLDPRPEVTNLVGPNAVANRHAQNDTNAMFGKSVYNPRGVNGDAYGGATANKACRVPLHGDFTVAGWGYVATTDSMMYNTILSQYVANTAGRMGLYVTGSNQGGRPSFQITSKFLNNTAGTSLVDGQWHYIVGTKVQGPTPADASTMTLYVDGVQEATFTGVLADIVDADFLIVGRSDASSRARVDDISVWDEALSAEQIAYIYDQGKNYGKSLADVLKIEFDPMEPTVNEGQSSSYTVVLNSQPGTDVTVSMDPNLVDLGAGVGAVVTKTFTPANWNVPQTVTVTAPDNTIVEGLRADRVFVSVPDPNTDPNFSLVTNDAFYITIVDDEKYLMLTDADPGQLVVSEQDQTTDDFYVNLAFQPTDTVTVDVGIDSQINSRYPTQLTFTPTDWSTPKYVRVRAKDDTIVETEPHYGTVTLTVSIGGDVIPVYGTTVPVMVHENDCGALSYGYLPGDLNKDCLVDLSDFAVMAANWLECTLPTDVTCVDAR